MFYVGFKVIALFVAGIGSGIFETERALRNIEATANIIGFIVGAYLANKIYRRITK